GTAVEIHTDDSGTSGSDAGGSIEIYGTITAGQVDLFGGAGNDVFAITASSSPTTVYAGAGDDTIYVGSKATTTTNTGGNANGITGKLIINGQGDSDRVVID